MRAATASKFFHHEARRVEFSFFSIMCSAGSLLLTIVTILILYFGVFVIRTN